MHLKSFNKFLLIILFLLFVNLVDSNKNFPEPIVSTEYGKIEGLTYVTPKGFRAEIFLGIPFAQPPINELRFEKPIPPKPKTSPLKAKVFGSKCPTFNINFPPNLSEDCLTLNIMKPEAPSNDENGYPVMIYIHGGGFIMGSSADFPYQEVTERLVSRGIILVTINYRLGPFGFFSTGDSNAPGNYGLWDQVQALKFIQQTIAAFNGNPKAVTIFGQSAGGASVSWLTISPSTKDLFSKAIIMSGSASAPWAHAEENLVENSKKLIEVAGCSQNKNPIECLKAKSTIELLEATSSFVQMGIKADEVNFGYFYPRFDNDFVKSSHMEEAIKKATKKPNLLGVTSQEHITFAFEGTFGDSKAKLMPISKVKALNFTRDDFAEIVYEIIATEKVYGSKAQEAEKKIIEFYENQNKLYTKNPYLQIYIQIFSDINFNIPQMREALQKAANGHETYFYVYNYVPDVLKNELLEFAGHGTEFQNIFGSLENMPFPTIHWEDEGVAKVTKNFTDFFVNFVKTGVPASDNLSAVKVTTKLPYFNINAVNTLGDNLWADRLQFWGEMAKEYGFDWPEYRKIVSHDEL